MKTNFEGDTRHENKLLSKIFQLLCGKRLCRAIACWNRFTLAGQVLDLYLFYGRNTLPFSHLSFSATKCKQAQSWKTSSHGWKRKTIVISASERLHGSRYTLANHHWRPPFLISTKISKTHWIQYSDTLVYPDNPWNTWRSGAFPYIKDSEKIRRTLVSHATNQRAPDTVCL